MQMVPLFIGRRKRTLRSFSSGRVNASFLGNCPGAQSRGSTFRRARYLRTGHAPRLQGDSRWSKGLRAGWHLARYWRSVQMKQLGLVTAVLATLALTPSPVLAQQKTLYVAGYGGS